MATRYGSLLLATFALAALGAAYLLALGAPTDTRPAPEPAKRRYHFEIPSVPIGPPALAEVPAAWRRAWVPADATSGVLVVRVTQDGRPAANAEIGLRPEGAPQAGEIDYTADHAGAVEVPVPPGRWWIAPGGRSPRCC